MARIIKVYQEETPALTLIGKLYHDGDRDAHHSFSEKWEEGMESGELGKLCADMQPIYGDAYVGAMRMNEGVFEYWIGVLTEGAHDAPSGFSKTEVPGGTYAVAWIQGRDDPSLYGLHDACMEAFGRQGWTPADNAWYIERYNDPRYTKPDENGEIILDYLALLK